MDKCIAKRVQLNAAQHAVERATADFTAARQANLACLGPEAQGNAAVEDAAGSIQKAKAEKEQLQYIHEFIVKHAERVGGSQESQQGLTKIVNEEAGRLQNEIDELKGKIRKSRRIFLDSGPQISPAVGGLYFTQVPDNQVLIAFLSCFGAFLLFAGLIFGLNLPPVQGLYLNLTQSERWRLVGGGWLGILVVTYVALWLLT